MNLSIIIPVHNAARTLKDCLESVLRLACVQEVICVDDGSTDDSAALLSQFAARDKRIQLLHTSSQGAGAARNKGLAAAQGFWLWFIDADDFIPSNSFADQLGKTLNENSSADIILFNASELDDRTHWRTPLPFNLKTAAERSALSWLIAAGTAPWNKIFRRDFITAHHLTFQEIARTNDVAFVVTALALAQTIRILPATGYIYRINASTSLQQTTAASPLCFHDAIQEIAARLKAHNAFTSNEAAFKFLALRMIIGNIFSFRSKQTFLEVCSFLHQAGDEFGTLSNQNCRGTHFLLATYRTILAGRLPNRALGRIRFSIYNRGFIPFFKHAIGRLLK